MQTKLGAIAVATALVGILAAGCSKPADTSSSSSTDSSASAAPAVAASASSDAASSSASPAMVAAAGDATAGDATKGEALFSANCAGCHGAAGAGGGVGPSLKGEKSRKDTAAAIAWIKNPQAPMPKLYPSPLSEKDVADVAAYVESL